MYKSVSVWLSATHFEFPPSISSLLVPSQTNNTIHVNIGTLKFEKSTNNVENIVSEVKRVSSNIPFQKLKLEACGEVKSHEKQVFIDVKENSKLTNLYQTLSKILGDSHETFKPQITICQGNISKELESRLKESDFIRNLVLEVDGIDVTVSGCCNQCNNTIHVGRVLFQSDLFLRSSLFINGKWTSPKMQNTFPVYNPSNGKIFHHVSSGTSYDIELAVASAQKAFPSWSSLSPETRAKYLHKIADIIDSKADELTRLEVIDNGKPLKEAQSDISDVVACFRYYADLSVKFFANQGKKIDVGDPSVESEVYYEPVGVAALIVPWNYPLLMATWKVAPCLAAGSTCVLKPSELTPLSALELGAIAQMAGLPPGVLNIVTGYGPEAGAPLAEHPGVDKVAFTGSVLTGSKVMKASADLIKNVTLELGGKSPIIICKDADIEQAVEWICFGIFFNGGQVCSATSRLLVHKDLEKVILNRLVEVVNNIVIGNGLDEKTILGPLVSEGQWKKVLNYIETGKREGATLLCGGGVPKGEQYKGGYYVQPTIFINVEPHMTIWKEEIFGPVLCCKSFETEQEAIELANNTDYGLGAAVFSTDKETCKRISRAIRSGIVWTNCSQPTYVQAPWGGMKKSGLGRELGKWGLLNYLEVKQVTSWIDKETKSYNWYTSKL